MRRVLIMQARVGSTRLPGKVLKEVLPGRTMLDLTLERLRSCQCIDEIVVAVPVTGTDDAVADEARRCGAAVVRGSEQDVLARYVLAATTANAEVVVRVTSDCPLTDPDIIDLHVERMTQGWSEFDFVTNMLRPTYPMGLAVEVMPVDVLRRMDRLSTTPSQREHVTLLAYEATSLFRVDHVTTPEDNSAQRWVVDYPADFDFVQSVFRALYDGHTIFRARDVFGLLNRQPELRRIALQRPA